MHNKNNCNCGDKHSNCSQNTEINYGYYSKLLKQPFDSVAELRDAEAAYYTEQKAKADKAAAKKADAQKVEDAFKALNAARKTYKEDLTQLTKEYSAELTKLKNALELGKKDIQDQLAAAEAAYDKALKEFTSKYDQYHMCLKDGDFETTISHQSNVRTAKKDDSIMDIFNLFFGI